MARFCLDTSWISNPLQTMPPDVHVTLWKKIFTLVEDCAFCWTEEISHQLERIPNAQFIEILKVINKVACFDLEKDGWPRTAYQEHFNRVTRKYQHVIKEYNGDRQATIDIADCSIVCLGITLGLPVVSMEKPNDHSRKRRMRIPDLCEEENVTHYDMTQFLRQEGITL